MNPSLRAGFEERPHTADRALRIWAADLASLFAESARGMYWLMEVQRAEGPSTSLAYEAQASDPEGLLVAFLSELLYLLESERLAFDRFELECQAGHLRAVMSGAPVQSFREVVKAITYHNLNIQHWQDRCEVEIVFDV
jgi:SHS2 domain-containing protein